MEGLLCLICGEFITHDFASHVFPMLTRDTTIEHDTDPDGDGKPVTLDVTMKYEFCAGDLCILETKAWDPFGSPIELTEREVQECHAALNEIFERETCCDY